MRLLYRVRVRRDHGWAVARISEYLDGELADGRRVRLERHMSDCPDCARLVAELRLVVERLGQLSSPGAGTGAAAIAARVRERLDEPPPRPEPFGGASGSNWA